MNLPYLFVFGLVCASAANVVVNPITGVTTNNLMYTGSIPVSDTSSSNLFFTYYGVDGETNPDNLNQKPLIIGVGNPGASAQYLNLGGIGPLNLKNDLTLGPNEGRVTQFANVMFLDLLGSGFSFAASTDQLPKTSADYGKQLTYSINAFIAQASIGKSDAIYLVGEGTFLRSIPGLDDIDPLAGIFHIGGWPDFYALGKYYGVAGIDFQIFTNAQRITIQTTFTTCYNYQRNSKFTEAHQCYDTTLDFVESKTKNRNLFDVRLQSNLTDFVPMIFYYFSQDNVVSKYKAPTTLIFQGQSTLVFANLYSDMGKNYDKQISQFFKDYLSVKNIFIIGDYDYITYNKAFRNWVENDVTFVESDAFRSKKIQNYNVDGKLAGYTKAVKQIAYFQVLSAGHYTANDQPKVIASIIKDTLQSNQQKMLQSQQ